MKERLKQKAKLFGARALAAGLGVFLFLSTYYLIDYLKKTYFFQNKVTELDQVVLSQKATIDHLDERWAETVTDLKKSREAADSFFQKMAQGSVSGGGANRTMDRDDLEKSREYYLKTLEDVAKNDEAALERGRALHSLAHIERKLGFGDKSLEHFEQAIRVFEQLPEELWEDEEIAHDVRLRLADSYERVSVLYLSPVGSEALAALEQSVLWFGRLIEVDPMDVEAVTRQARTSFMLGLAYDAHRRYDDAISAYSRSAELAVQLREDLPEENEPLTELIGKLQFQAAGFRLPAPPMSEGDAHVINIPVGLINPDGVLDLVIINQRPDNQPQPTISFKPGEGLELLQIAGSFAPNLARAYAVLWVRLLFLAVVGLAAGSILSFPVAVLFSLVIYSIAAGQAYINESLGNYAYFPGNELPLRDQANAIWERITTRFDEGKYYDILKIFIRLIAHAVLALVPSFEQYDPGPLLAKGRHIPYTMISSASLWLAGVWSLVIGTAAYLLFRQREIARITV
ncbi:MAG: hypothetical protein AAGB14_13450 [Verrucomicrobiota bacterium]